MMSDTWGRKELFDGGIKETQERVRGDSPSSKTKVFVDWKREENYRRDIQKENYMWEVK